MTLKSCSIGAVALAALAAPASAQYYESATFVGGHSGGSTLYIDQFLGSHFTVPGGFNLEVSAIGGDVWTATPNGFMWGAIVDVNPNTGVPFSGVEDPTYLRGSVLYLGGDGSQNIDLVAPLVVTLPAGDYGVVLGGDNFGAGGGPFGSNGWGAMPAAGVNIPNGTNDFIGNNAGNWNNQGETSERLTVYGELVPVPSPGAGALIGLSGLVAMRRRRA